MIAFSIGFQLNHGNCSIGVNLLFGSPLRQDISKQYIVATFRLIQIEDNKLIRKRFGNDIPDVAVLAKNISLILVNQHYSFTGPKPLSNQVVEVSGIHLKPAKPLPQVKC